MSALYYTEQGKGKPLVLLHGFLENNTLWKEFSQALSLKYRVISFDLPGFGQSPLPHQPFSLTDVGNEIISILKTITQEKIALLGHSLGGYVILAMVEQQPHLFSSFGLFHSTAFADSAEKKEARTKTIEFVNRNGAIAFTSNFIPPLFANPNHEAIGVITKMATLTTKETVVSYLEAMRDRPDRTKVLTDFRGPILLIAGAKDSVIPVDSLKKQSKMTENALLKILEEVGHMGMLEASDESLKTVSDFF